MNMRKTKIICTLGPATDDDEILRKLMIEGMDVVNKIAETETDFRDRPLDDQQIKSMTVETFGASI